MKLDINCKYCVISKFYGEQPKYWENLSATGGRIGENVKSTMHYIVSCAADEHAENPDIRLEYLRIVRFNKRPGRKVLCEVSRAAMSPAELRRAYDIIMSW